MYIFVYLNAITLFTADPASVLHAYNKYHEMVSVYSYSITYTDIFNLSTLLYLPPKF